MSGVRSRQSFCLGEKHFDDARSIEHYAANRAALELRYAMEVITDAERFYSQPAQRPVTRQDVLDGRIIKINPALITITDGLVASTDTRVLQGQVYAHVQTLLGHGVRTFHVDINFPDYQGFGSHRPDINTDVFTPAFLAHLNGLVRSQQAFLNLHLLTADLHQQLHAFAHIPFGAICFQLDAVATSYQLVTLVNRIWQTGACVSPVIETVGSEHTPIPPPDAVLVRLEPVLARIGMLTLQAATTGARSSQAAAPSGFAHVQAYIQRQRPIFQGTFQLQGGITTRTIGTAVQVGAEFVVAGTELFHHPHEHMPVIVVQNMLAEAARVLLASGEGTSHHGVFMSSS